MLERMQQVFRTVFEDQRLVITPETSAKDIKMWDSLTHLELITAVETEFNLKFSFSEVMGFNNAGDMLRLIEKIMGK
ncbi:MAG: acyl carrier protein [Bacteroidetes bacterium]|nr:acyl carrier protein [Bacteroidota bacterium]